MRQIRFVAALPFVVLGGLTLMVGLVLLRPWLSRLSASSALRNEVDPLDGRGAQPYGPEAHEPNDQLQDWLDSQKPAGWPALGKWGES